MPKHPTEWTEHELGNVRRAIAEHRLSRVDLFYFMATEVEGRSLHDIARETWLTERQVSVRVESARALVEAAFDRPR